jgi:uncharacterized protein YjbI with pentapeptide repeats
VQTDFEGDELEPFEEYDGVRFEGQSFGAVAADNIRLLDCVFSRTTFEQTRCGRSAVVDSTMDDVRWIGAGFPDSEWREVTVSKSLAAGVDLTGASLLRVTFTDCKLQTVNLRGAKLKEVTFDRCVITELDVLGASLTKVTFRDCTIVDLDLTNATLAETDFRTSALEVRRGHLALAGAIIELEQLVGLAPGIAEAIGIDVR